MTYSLSLLVQCPLLQIPYVSDSGDSLSSIFDNASNSVVQIVA